MFEVEVEVTYMCIYEGRRFAYPQREAFPETLSYSIRLIQHLVIPEE